VLKEKGDLFQTGRDEFELPQGSPFTSPPLSLRFRYWNNRH